MKKTNLVMIAAIGVAALSACTATETEADKKVNELTTYVDSVDNLTPVYTTNNWVAIENGFQERIAELENEAEEIGTEQKAKLDETKAKYNEMKAAYTENIRVAEVAAANAVADYKVKVRNDLFGAGNIPSDMSFGYVTGDNLLGVFTKFVNTVTDNRDNYTREEWDEIKILWEALNTRKNEVEKDLSGSDNMKIAGLKVKFASVKATNRGSAKAEENREAKENN